MNFRDEVFIHKHQLECEVRLLFHKIENFLIIRIHLCTSLWVFKVAEFRTSAFLMVDYFRKNDTVFANLMKLSIIVYCHAIQHIYTNEPLNHLSLLNICHLSYFMLKYFFWWRIHVCWYRPWFFNLLYRLLLTRDLSIQLLKIFSYLLSHDAWLFEAWTRISFMLIIDLAVLTFITWLALVAIMTLVRLAAESGRLWRFKWFNTILIVFLSNFRVLLVILSIHGRSFHHFRYSFPLRDLFLSVINRISHSFFLI